MSEALLPVEYRFPFKSRLSLSNIIGYWQAKTNDPNAFIAGHAKDIVAQLEQAPELFHPIDDLTILDKHRDLVNMIMSALVPQALVDDSLTAAVEPFGMNMFYITNPMQQIMDRAGSFLGMLKNMDLKEMSDNKTMYAYASIMEQFYGVSLNLDRPIVAELTDEKTGLNKYYKVGINPRFCETVLHGDLPELSDEKIKHLIDNLFDIDLWKAELPPHLFEFRGFALYDLVDVTRQEVVSSIKELLLEKDSIVNLDSFDALQSKMQSLLQINDLRLGISGYQRNKRSFINFGKKTCTSIVIGAGEGITCVNAQDEMYHYFSANKRAMVIEDLSKAKDMEGFEQILMDEGIMNLVLAPLFYDQELIGMIELASPKVGDLNMFAVTKVEEILPLFAVAVKRSAEELENKVQSVIKEKYTSIHPSVEWKFVNAAYDYIEKEERGETPEAEQIIFENVYPLYGASDIRNSSVERNKAILSDLRKQLRLASKVLEKGFEVNQLPVINEVQYRLNKQIAKIKRGLLTGDEVAALDFLREEVEPILRNLETNHPDFQAVTSAYWNELDPKLQVVYESRKAFEESLTQINDAVGAIIDREEEVAQKMHPHFFEKYKTDGVEYNIYIGESLAETRKFDDFYLKNLRLWQLITTCEIARQTSRIIPELSLPLETTHLILVHSSPLAIKFRMDEKQFDVDGAYNIRYEIVKKRIDKALIRNSDERLTQPGKIAIVYSQDKDAQEYSQYLEYLHNKGYLEKEIEHLELEELQGVSGLRALRVKVVDSSKSVLGELEQLMQRA